MKAHGTPQEFSVKLMYAFEDYADSMELNLYELVYSRENQLKNEKACALIAIDLVISEIQGEKVEWWLDVRKELQKL